VRTADTHSFKAALEKDRAHTSCVILRFGDADTTERRYIDVSTREATWLPALPAWNSLSAK
jgi:hypothetical protein